MSKKPPVFPIRVSVTSGQFAARDAIQALFRKFRPLDLVADDLSTCELVLAEVLNNVVEHAYPEGKTAGPIMIECTEHEIGLRITVVDQGVGMPGGQRPDGQNPNVNVELQHLPEGGFGWHLIEVLARDITYQRLGWENRLSFTLPLTPREGEAAIQQTP